MSLIHLAHSSCTQQRNNLEGPELPPYERGLTLIFSQNFCRHFHRGPFQKFFRPVLLCQRRLHFLQQLFVPYAHLAQICRSLAFFAFQRRVIKPLDLLPTTTHRRSHITASLALCASILRTSSARR